MITKNDLLGALQHEVNLVLHLATKIDPAKLDYRPTPKQRSTIELLRYLAVVGPALTSAAVKGAFDPAEWTALAKDVESKDVAGVCAVIEGHKARYAAMLDSMNEAAMAQEIEMFGGKKGRGAYITFNVMGNLAAYRMQLFLYLKSCGREELNTSNLWRGVDPAPAPAA